MPRSVKDTLGVLTSRLLTLAKYGRKRPIRLLEEMGAPNGGETVENSDLCRGFDLTRTKGPGYRRCIGWGTGSLGWDAPRLGRAPVGTHAGWDVPRGIDRTHHMEVTHVRDRS